MFKVGDKVICIDNTYYVPNDKLTVNGLLLDTEYTIDRIECDMVYLKELPIERLLYKRFVLSRFYKINKIKNKINEHNR